MKLLKNCMTLGVIVVASCALAAPASAQGTSPSDVWVPDQPVQFRHGWFWDSTAQAWKYGWYQPGSVAPPATTRQYTLASSATRTIATPVLVELPGRILAVEQRNVSATAPPDVFVVMRTNDGTVRTIDLGNAQFVFQTLPNLRENEQVLLRGSRQYVSGRECFIPSQLATSQNVLIIPTYASRARVRGNLVTLYTIPGEANVGKSLVAQVRTPQGNLVDVVLGPADQVGKRFYSLRPGTPFVVTGFVQQTPSGKMLYAQNVSIQEQQPVAVVTQQQPTEVITKQPEVITTQQPSALVLNVEQPPGVRFMPATAIPTQTIKGDIVGLRSMWITGQWHVVADVVTDTGNFVRADLGPRSAIAHLNLVPGQTITIGGRRLFYGTQPMLVASQFSIGGPLYFESTPQLVGAVETTAAPVQMYHGQIVAKHSERIPGYKEKRVIIYMRLPEGCVVPVDLGVKECLKGIDLDRNDYVTVWAANALVNGQPGLVASQIQRKDKVAQLGQCE